MAMSFVEKRATKKAEGKHLCIGLDPNSKRHPKGISVIKYFLKVLEATIDIAGCYKPNFAFFGALGQEGVSQLKTLVTTINRFDPTMPVIGDGKRGDIGSTNAAYSTEAFNQFGVDALTVNPYLGLEDASDVFLRNVGKTIIVLCRTSNKGSGAIQDRLVDVSDDLVNGRNHVPLYQFVARWVSRDWAKLGSVGLVAGATYPAELKEIRRIAPDTFVLIPGVGSQHGDLDQSVVYAAGRRRLSDFVINVSEKITYAGPKPNIFMQEALEAAKSYDYRIREAIK